MFCPVYTVADKFLSGYARSPRDQDSSVARILVRGRPYNCREVRGMTPRNVLNFGSLKRHFLHFEGTFERNI